MKKKFLLALAIVAILTCIFAISISAAGATENTYGELTTIEGVDAPTTIDTTSRVVIVASDGTYYTFPAYYILEDNATFRWKQNAEVSAILGYKQSNANSDFRERVIRMELPLGITAINPGSDGGAYALEDARKLIEVTFPATLTQVGNYSFNRCYSLTTINGASEFFARATKIGTLAFADTSWGEGFDLVFPTQISKVSDSAFFKAKIKSVTFHEGITEIGSCAFQNCSNLTSVTLPSSLVNLKNHAFASCTSLTSIDVSSCKNIATIGEYCFEKTKITSFDFTPFAKNMTSIGVGLFNSCQQLSTVTGYELVECANEVGDKMFNECPLLKIVFPPNITKIGQYAYYHSDDTGAIEVPDAVTYIGQYAFSWSNINSISLPANLVTLCNHVFANCRSLATVDTEGCTSIKYIGRYCFEDAVALTAFDFTPFATTLETIEVDRGASGTFNRCTSLATVTGLDKLTQITVIPNNMFYNCPITEIKLPEGLVEIGSYAFFGHRSAQSEFRIPNTVTTIADHAFAKASGYKGGADGLKIYLPASLETIGGTYTFEYWYYEEMYIPAGVNIPDGFSNGTLQSGVVYYYTGNIDTLTIGSTNNPALSNAEWISVDDFTGAASDKNYIVYGYNFCEAFYAGAHNAKGEGTIKFTGDKYTSSCISEAECSRNCGKSAIVEICGPLFENKGYSKVQDGTSFTYGIVINDANIATYVEATGDNAFNYGFIVGAVPATPTGAIVSAEGKSLIDKSIITDFASVNYNNFTIYNVKMVGIETAEQKSQAIYCCAYIIDNGAVTYMGETISSTAIAISSDTITVIEATAPSTSEEE